MLQSKVPIPSKIDISSYKLEYTLSPEALLENKILQPSN